MNKTGKGGFGDNPDNINREGRKCINPMTEALKHGKEPGDYDLISAKVWQMAKAGDKWAIEYITDRVEGKAVQKVEQKTEILKSSPMADAIDKIIENQGN